jgi:hypothetical protein
MKFLVYLALALSCSCCFAEETGKGRTCRMIFVDAPRDAPKEVQFFDGVVSRKVLLPSMNLSEVIKLPAGDLVLSMTRDPIFKPEDLAKDAPSIKISAKITDFYLIVVSDPENKILPLRMLPVDVTDKVPKIGQTLWINLTAHAINGNLGDATLVVPPDERVICGAPIATSGYYKAEFSYQPNGEGEFLPVMKKSWWFDATSKHLGFVVNSNGQLPKIFTLRDRPAPKPVKAKNVE